MGVAKLSVTFVNPPFENPGYGPGHTNKNVTH